jgi:wobble nucleotide-excising tRNase
MMAFVKRIRSLKGVGILADKRPNDPGADFLKMNLIYGFNGSGKSTLSRLFTSLQQGCRHTQLPEDCTFEIEFDGDTIYSGPDNLQGVEERVCVFNTDFVAENLQWEKGTASSIFYLSHEQADLVAQLRDFENMLPAKQVAFEGALRTEKAAKKNFSTYCTERAKTVHSARHLGTRKYEAPKLKNDYISEKFDTSSILAPEELLALQEVVTRTAPPSPLAAIKLDYSEIRRVIGLAIKLAGAALGATVLKELSEHPKMVPWVKDGQDYHVGYGLQTCLFCKGEFTDARKEQLAAALDDKLSQLMKDIADTKRIAEDLRSIPALNKQALPKATELEPSCRAKYPARLKLFENAAALARGLLEEASVAMSKRLRQPTHVAIHSLPPMSEVESIVNTLEAALEGVNNLFAEHNEVVENFTKRQSEASLEILRHFLADGQAAFTSAKVMADDAAAWLDQAAADVQATEQKIIKFKAELRAHGPAAQKICKLVHDYLGHKELTIVATDQGYSLHRNGRPVKGPPSEGEKTAIALCYFLSTLEAEGRALKDLVVVIDDPISSLDTKAMNYACALVLKKLEKVGQLIVLTHNHHCMNEFKKAWKARAYPRNHETLPTARLLYVDVQLPENSATRSARIVEMSHLLREYDSEYHFLCQKIFEFEAAGYDHSPNLLLMPNAMRRVMEIFLAFKVPGTAPIKDRLKTLADRHPELDPVRIAALERLSQVESHSDNLDDLVGHSPMIVEEVRQTSSALLELMAMTDEPHTTAIRKQCKVNVDQY